MLKDLQSLVNELNESNSNLDKKKVLEKYPQCKELLRYVYSPFTQFNVTSKNLKKRTDLVEETNLNIIELLDQLNNRDITGHKALSVVNGFIQKNEEYRDLIYNIIDKNLKTRTDTKTINSVFPGTVEEFNVQLADSFDKNQKRVDLSDTWYASRKLDGCLYYNTLIEFEDGNKLKIGEIIENTISGKIKTYNIKNKKIEYKKIKNWMKNLKDVNEDNTEWYKITLENNNEIILTGNHRIWIDNLNCWRRVDNLDGSEILLLS